MTKWTYELGFDSENWSQELFDSKEEVIKIANSQAILNNETQFRVGVAEEILDYSFDGNAVIQDIKDAISVQVFGAEEEYLANVTREEIQDLEDQLNKVLYNWQTKYNYEPLLYGVVDIETIDVVK